MKKFNVSVRETLIKSVSVEADNIEAAKEIVKSQYDESKIVLDCSDFTGDVDVRVYDENFTELEDWDENYIK